MTYKKRPGYVYLFRNEFNYVKIGHATNPNNRARNIESSSGLTVTESHISPVCFNYVEIEGELKRQFSDYRKKGEWFDIELETVKTALDSYFQTVETPTIKPIIAISNQTLSDNQEPTVNARELHAFLEVETPFSIWIKRRIEEYRFVEGQDFLTNLLKTPSDAGGRPSKEYFLSLDMAKELSMVERTTKGKEARQYFIACEKSLKQGNSLVLNNDLRNVIYTVVTQALEDLSKPKPPQREAGPDLPIDDSIDGWFKACVVLDPNAQINVGCANKKPNGSYRNVNKWLYPNYRKFCERENLEPIPLYRFSRQLLSYCRQRDLNVKRLHRSNDGAKIKGIAIREGF